jgi:YesN/AraC family two-component response regulator
VKYSDDFEKVEISVKDSGIGISESKVKHIFDRFYQGDSTHQRNYEGSGIGLALVKEMVELHKGSINVESKEGEGTTFTVKLSINKKSWEHELENNIEELDSKNPLDFMLNEQTQPTPVVEHIPKEDDKILLIVEDNLDLRQYIRTFFEKEYQIVEASDGQEGIEKALVIIPDIVISDLMMPRLDGLDFCKLLKTNEKTSHIPIVMLTAKANVESRIEGFELGADDYLTKPFNSEELLVRVRNLVAQRQLLQQKYDIQIVDLKPNEVKVSSVEEKFVLKAKGIIEKYISESEFDVEKFAEEMDMSVVVLRRKLKAITNNTVTEFVRKYRLQRAAELLSKRTGTVSEIAYQVGFESLSYFTKAFQEEFGKSPSEYGK